MGDALDITVRRERGVVIAAVTGDVDIFTVARLRAGPLLRGTDGSDRAGP